MIITPRSDDPDFVPSLRLLVEEEKYSLTDVGLMFDVSRERVRQWCQKHEIMFPKFNIARGLMATRGLNAVRIWDDKLNRFFPVSKSVIREETSRRKTVARQQKLTLSISERRSFIINQAVELKNKLERDPTTHEIAIAVIGCHVKQKQAAALLTGKWGGRGSAKEKYGEFRSSLRAVGVFERPTGNPGHVISRNKKLYCKRGHLRSLTANKWGYCRVCRDWSMAAYSARCAGKPIPSEPIVVHAQVESTDSL